MRSLFSFRGRSGRLAFFGVVILQAAPVLLLAAVDIAARVLKIGHWRAAGSLSWIIVLAVIVFTMWTVLAAMARRIRDIGLPVWLGLTLALGSSVVAERLLDQIRHLGSATPIWLAAAWAACVLLNAITWAVIFLWPGRPALPFEASRLDEVFGGQAPPSLGAGHGWQGLA